jgi:ABC transporter with metal-binding/Fe-S-binding domain ATP-binding protein
MKVAVLFSGGKDSAFAAFCALFSGWDVSLLTMVSGEDSMMFHRPNVEWCKLQAEAMGLPLEYVKTGNERELEDMKKALAKMHVDGVVAGAIESEYQKQRIDQIADELGIRSFAPIWRKKEALASEVAEYFDARVAAVAAEGLGEDFLWRKFDAACMADMKKRSPSAHFFFEGGEGETFVCDAPFFSKKVVVKKVEKKWQGQSGVAEIIEAELAGK